MTVMTVAPVPETPEPSLVVVKWARLETGVTQVAVEVPDWMWTLKVLPGPGEAVRSPTLQVKTLGVTPVLMLQDALVGLIDQLRPLPVGRLSVMTTPWATPAPPLVAVMV